MIYWGCRFAVLLFCTDLLCWLLVPDWDGEAAIATFYYLFSNFFLALCKRFK